MTKPDSADNLDSFLGDLQRELSVTPSPDFAARVRARVDRETSRAWSPLRWFLGSFALASAAVVMFMISNRPESTPVHPSGAVAAYQPSSAVPAIEPTPAPSVPATPRPVRRTARTRTPVRATSQGLVSADLVSGDPMAVDPTKADPAVRTIEVIVPPDQAIALRQLLIGMRVGRSGAPPPGSPPSAFDPLPDMPPIAIAPIRIQALPGSVSGGGRR